jgi:ribonuclease BN (tRNA processing enzyme)
MKIKILGAHNTESLNSHYISLLVDDSLVLDAGSLTSSLSFEQQADLKAVLLTHGHYDHIRDIPALAINLFLRRSVIPVYTHQAVYDILTTCFLNGKVYSEFHKERNGNQASLDFHIIRPLQSFEIAGYHVLGVPVRHAVETLGYQISGPDGSAFFYSGDTGSDLASTWSHIAPQVLFIEVTSEDRWSEALKKNGHLTPALLKEDLIAFYHLKKYLPRVITLHMNPLSESKIRAELEAVSRQTGIPIEMGYEGLQVQI